ncbi:TPA: hypothetical protein KC499_005200 [Escherichia coli O146]|nr:hypothetical protein [Escherichia coli O146]HBC3173465.1 hypothetical protein [Escherichia coli O146]HBC3244761.1 hypothetical protein [Escherichia coli O146]
MRRSNQFPPGSLNIKLKTPLTKYEIMEVMAEYLSMLELVLGVEEFKLYAYLECIVNGEKQAIYHKDKNAIVSEFTLASMGKIKNRKLDEVAYGEDLIKEGDDERIKSILNMLNINAESCAYENFKEKLMLVPSGVVNDLIERNIRLMEIERESKIKEDRERLRKEKEKEKGVLKIIYDNKLSEYSCSFYYFKTVYLSSVGFLVSEKQKAKYFLAEGLESLLESYIGKKVIRLSLKGEDGKVSVIEIYNENGEFLFRTKPLAK